MKKQTRSNRIKDDASIRQITEQIEEWRRSHSIQSRPHDFKAATELWRLWQTLETFGEAQPEGLFELKATVEEGKLVLKEPAPLPVHDNEIHLGKTKIVITLEG